MNFEFKKWYKVLNLFLRLFIIFNEFKTTRLKGRTKF